MPELAVASSFIVLALSYETTDRRDTYRIKDVERRALFKVERAKVGIGDAIAHDAREGCDWSRPPPKRRRAAAATDGAEGDSTHAPRISPDDALMIELGLDIVRTPEIEAVMEMVAGAGGGDASDSEPDVDSDDDDDDDGGDDGEAEPPPPPPPFADAAADLPGFPAFPHALHRILEWGRPFDIPQMIAGMPRLELQYHPDGNVNMNGKLLGNIMPSHGDSVR